MVRNCRWVIGYAVLVCVLIPELVVAQTPNQLGKIIGVVRVSKGDFPAHAVLVSLEVRGAAMDSVYADDQGRFGFYGLLANEYRVTVNDEAYEPVSQDVRVDASTAPMNFVQVTLVPRSGAKKVPTPARIPGSNPYLVDPAEYYRRFPKKTLSEFQRGVDADHKGKIDEAIAHYEKALTYSPEFYPAHNNLGSDYLGRQDFDRAREQFEAALKTNQNDDQAYFNLGNLHLLTKHYDDAERRIEEGLQKRPDSAFGHFLRGSLFAHTGRFEEAEKSLLDALQLDPTMSQAHLQLVNLYLQQRRNPEAIKELEAYLKNFPDTPFSPKARELLKRLRGETTSSPR